MTDLNTKMLQQIIDSVSGLHLYIDEKIESLRKDIKRVENKLEAGIDRLDKRIDKIGKRLAYLEDDAPTREEFDSLDSRVNILEDKSRSN